MKKFIVCMIVLAAAAFSASASRQGTDWKGVVLDENGEAMPYATVALVSMPDSTIVAGTTTAEDGTFALASEARDAVLMVAMIGYRTVYADQASCGTIRMELSSEMLGEAVVSAVMPKTKLTDQGLQTSVRGSVLENAGTANDVLSKIPGLIKGQDGIEVLGKGSPLFYINGRKVTDATELQILQSTEIQSVEVITNPGAQYDASIRSVVRIRTIRHQGDGFGFNAGLTDEQSLRKKTNDPSGYVNANYRHNGLDVFAGVNAFQFTSTQDSDMLQETFGDPGFKQVDVLRYWQQQVETDINGGLNWQINDNHSTGVRVDAYIQPRMSTDQSIDGDIYRGGELIDRLHTKGASHIGDLPWTIKVNTYYNGTVGKLGIDFNADYFSVKMSDESFTDETSEMAQNDHIEFSSGSDSRMFATKLVLSYPIWKGALQVGTEETFTRRSDNYVITKTTVPCSETEVREDNIAAFASYGFYIPKAGQFSAGLRYEHVNYQYDDKLSTSEDDPSRKYDNVFPSVSYANAFGPVQLQASYSAKTHRPDFHSLSSNVRYHSRYILQSGNNKLQPQENHDFGLNVNWKRLTMVTQYSRINSAITQWSSLYDDSGIVIVRPVNIDRPMRTLAWFINASPTIGIWTMNYTAGVQQQWLTLDCPDVREPDGIRSVSFNDKPMWIAQLFNTFRFKHNWQVELGGEYHSPGYASNALVYNHFFNLTAAVQKTFLDNALVLRLEGSDLAGLANYYVNTDCGSHFIQQTNIMDSQRVKLSVRYNFNTASNKYKGTGAGSDAAARMR